MVAVAKLDNTPHRTSSVREQRQLVTPTSDQKLAGTGVSRSLSFPNRSPSARKRMEKTKDNLSEIPEKKTAPVAEYDPFKSENYHVDKPALRHQETALSSTPTQISRVEHELTKPSPVIARRYELATGWSPFPSTTPLMNSKRVERKPLARDSEPEIKAPSIKEPKEPSIKETSKEEVSTPRPSQQNNREEAARKTAAEAQQMLNHQAETQKAFASKSFWGSYKLNKDSSFGLSINGKLPGSGQEAAATNTHALRYHLFGAIPTTSRIWTRSYQNPNGNVETQFARKFKPFERDRANRVVTDNTISGWKAGITHWNLRRNGQAGATEKQMLAFKSEMVKRVPSDHTASIVETMNQTEHKEVSEGSLRKFVTGIYRGAKNKKEANQNAQDAIKHLADLSDQYGRQATLSAYAHQFAAHEKTGSGLVLSKEKLMIIGAKTQGDLIKANK